MTFRTFGRAAWSTCLATTLALGATTPASAQVESATALDTPITASRPAASVAATGRRQIVVRLTVDPVARRGGDRAAQQAQGASVDAQQARVLARLQALDASARVLGQLRVALNAVILDVDAAMVGAIAADAEVSHVGGVANYEHAAQPPMETVPYIGARPEVQQAPEVGGGRDVKVAVLDSGIDYTHAALGGPGTLAAYQAAYGNPASTDGLFPTARVKGGYDFVGEAWPNGPLAPDPDPIDFEGHGTHVADIIGGEQGVAPNVDLYAVKVCSAVSSSCSGVAILQGLEWAADPNGDGDTSDHMNVVNLSLGLSYGQNYDQDDAIAIDNLTPIGMLFVVSAGNSADRPYIVGTPSAARTALSVAQTAVPSDIVFPIVVGATTVYGLPQPWAPLPVGTVSGALQWGDGAGGNRLGCSPFPAGSLAGKVLIVDRGACNASVKGANGSAGGAAMVIIANNVAGAVPPSFSFGGGTITVPTLTVTQAGGTQLKSRAGQTASVDGATSASTVGSVVGTSSRGPTAGQMFYGNSVQYGQIVKPEIGAPGASISAIAGSGTGVEAFGGTSGAAPMVAGAAALLMNATNWQLSAFELKTRLMNTAERNIFNAPPAFGGQLAPISRIGGGEVRIDRAITAQASAWEQVSRGGALSFGLVDARTAGTSRTRTVVVRNYGSRSLSYTIQPTFRYANDAATAAVTVTAPASVAVPARSSRTFTVTLTVDPTRLPAWVLNSGPNGGNGDALTAVEYDGYLLLDAAGTDNDLAMPWHVLPRAAGSLSAPATVTASNGTAAVPVQNTASVPSSIESFSLVGSNPFVTAGGFAGQGTIATDLRHVGVRTLPGGCGSGNATFQVGINTWQRTTHANYPITFIIDFDVNDDGVWDYQGFTSEVGAFASTGQNAFFVGTFGSNTGSAFFFTGHPTSSADTVVTFCQSQLGGAPLGRKVRMRVFATDNYFTGNDLSVIDGMTFTLGGDRYAAPSGTVPAGASVALPVTVGPNLGTSESGVLLLLNTGLSTAAAEGNEARAVKIGGQ